MLLTAICVSIFLTVVLLISKKWLGKEEKQSIIKKKIDSLAWVTEDEFNLCQENKLLTSTYKTYQEYIKHYSEEKERIDKKVNDFLNSPENKEKMDKAVDKFIDDLRKRKNNNDDFVRFKDLFRKPTFKNSKLRQEKVIKVISREGHWNCPSCNKINKENYKFCEDCGQIVEKLKHRRCT